MGGGHAVAISTGSGQALWMTDGSKGRELLPGDTDLTKKMVLAGQPTTLKKSAENRAFIASSNRDLPFTYDSFEAILADERVDVALDRYSQRDRSTKMLVHPSSARWQECPV